MNRIIIISLLLIFQTFTEALAQKKMQVKYEVGIAHTDYELINPQNNVQILNNNHAIYGVNLSYELIYNIHVETGVYSKYYGADFYSNSPDTTNLILGVDRIQIPIRLVYKKNILSERFYLSLFTGSSILIGHSQSSFMFLSDNEYKSIGNKPKRTFGLVEIGLGMEYEIFSNFSLGFNIRSFFGLKQNIYIQYDNINSDNSITNYDIKSNGSFQAYTVAVGYKFGKKAHTTNK
ncbi:hypothetical protein [Persicobacter psychrovividus]|uniref:Outer membrane protein beta-barrel domain-containing protein n=1 Tax=Persicobacter psychrovividus TaxID=387638 RepID=A0ABM7VJT4_9BACT|nr:hypothetical protein PEPS_35340 [Persicobacter psychrovividus]